MQVYTSKNILLISFFLLILLPAGLSAQVGMKKYITRSGDTTIIVNAASGLKAADARFLYDEGSREGLNRRSRYNRLKDAVDETNQVADVVEVESKETNPSSGSLGFRIAQKNIRYLQNEQKATRIAHENINRDATVEELTYLKEKFGGKPSYFVNGIQVTPELAASVSHKDLLSRDLKVTNTTTGNPNGEIWYVVNTKTFARLGLEDYEMPANNYATTRARPTSPSNSFGGQKSILDEEIGNAPSSITPSEYNKLSPKQQQSLSVQQQEIDELRKQIEEVRRQRAAMSGTSYEPSPTSGSGTATPDYGGSTYTRPNLQRRTQAEDIVGFRDSPQERTRRERDELEITDETPKRSVRRIKERERSR